MDSIERLVALFERFPGIGPRQAGRFVQFLLRSSPAIRRELIDAVQELSGGVHQCKQCMRWHTGLPAKASATEGDEAKATGIFICNICSNPQRDTQMLAVVASDTDLAALERSGTYRGHYFVLGGTISLASEKMSGLRIKQLLDSIPIREKNGLKEVILAFPANPEGDATAIRVREELIKMIDLRNQSLKITSLGRGLSTGSELEYADPDTLRSAIDNRK